jgi:phospholipase B1
MKCIIVVFALLAAALCVSAKLPNRQFSPAFDGSKRPSWLMPERPTLDGCSYTCSGPAPGTITSISDLRPCDVKVVAALGDSITAAFAAAGGLWEYRGNSYFIGMGNNATTTANLLKAVNPGVIGGPSVGHIPEVAGNWHDPLQDILSAAQSEAKVADLLPGGRGPQVPYLLQQLQGMQDLGELSIKDDWKIVNIWIGANDLCEVCHNMNPGVKESAEYYAKELNKTIAMIQQNVPKTFINLIPYFGLAQIYNLTKPYLNCQIIHGLFDECACMYSKNQVDRNNMDIAGAEYNKKMFELAKEWTGVYDDFAVVVQPGNIDFVVPSIEFVSTLDCFHPSLYTHELLGVGIWNQMMQPIAEKTYPWKLPQSPVCPSSDAKFYSN